MTTDCESIRVVVRCRPFSTREKEDGHFNVVDAETNMINLKPVDATDALKQFSFDAAFGQTSGQYAVYEMAAKPIIESVLAGYNGTIFAYGQTGTGKNSGMGDKDDESMRGVIPNAIIHIFNYINENAATGSKFLVRASFLEIYNEDVYDLLANQETKLELRERSDIGVYVKNLSSFVVNSVEEMYKLMTVGNRNRSVGSTMMNARSSRSHSIFTITV
ncbi:P-loop containing nucleoside triphosphate hydrolase protein, partial [Rozella allomycis CSF55]